jgi:hypothetical protein
VAHVVGREPRLQPPVEGDHGAEHAVVGHLAGLGELDAEGPPIGVRAHPADQAGLLEVVEVTRQRRALDVERAGEVELRRPRAVLDRVEDQPDRDRSRLAWIVALVLLFRFVLPRGFCGWRRGGSGPDRAHGILAERYARGEIDDAEYRSRLDRLRSDA